MHSEDLLVNDGGDWQAVETVGKCFPQLNVVPTLALVVKAIDTIDTGAFVVPAENEEVLWILDLVCEEETDGFERLLASIDIVA